MDKISVASHEIVVLKLESENAILQAENARLREALVDALNWRLDVEEEEIPPEDVRIISVPIEGTYRLHHILSGKVVSCDTKEEGMTVLKKRVKEWRLKERKRLVRENASLFDIIRDALEATHE